MVKTIADGDRTVFERGDIVIRELCKLTENILDYRYAGEHYDGDGTVLEDKKNKIKKTLVLVKSDLDVYMEQLGITDEVRDNTAKRLDKITKKIM